MSFTLTKKESGFTLIELLVVIVVISILALLLVPNLTSAQRRARDADRKNDLRANKDYLETYYLDKGYYPGGDINAVETELVAEGYVTAENFAEADQQGNDYTYSATQSDGATACTTAAGDCATYTMSTTLENDKDPDYGTDGTYSVNSLN